MSAVSSHISPRQAGWLFGPAIDLLLGCGLIYALLVGLLFLLQPKLGQLGPWLPLVILLTGVPHYGATLLRVFATPEDRRRHAFSAIVASICAAVLLLIGLGMPRIGALVITLYLTFSPYHYAAQNYGITMMFLRRRGSSVDVPLRRLLRLSFVSSFLLVALSYHQVGAAGGNDPLYAASAAFRFLPLGIPARVLHVLTPLLFTLHAMALFLTLRMLLRGNRLRALIPSLALLFSQSVWFSVPALVSLFWPGHHPGNQVAFSFVWIALGHCVQYLWISTYFHRAAIPNSDSKKDNIRLATAWYLLRVTLIGASLRVVPALLLHPGAFGRVPFEAGLGLLIAAVVNLHHFVLDGLIWRLREPRIGALLVHGPSATPQHAIPNRFAAVFRARNSSPILAGCILFAIGGFSIFVWLGAAWEREIGHRRAYAAKDIARLAQASERLAAIGRDGPQIHIALGRLHAQKGNLEAAAKEFRRSLQLQPTAAAWRGLGKIHQARGQYEEAENAYRVAETLAEDSPKIR